MVDGLTPSALSLVPPLTAIVLAFLTRKVFLALCASIASAGVVLAYQLGTWSGLNVFEHFVFPALFSKSYGNILLIYLLSLGTIIGMWRRTGGARLFAQKAGDSFAHSANSSLLFAWLLGFIFHQGGTISTVLTGSTVKPLCDKHRVSHEELAYVVDSTASPIATLIPFNAWPAYVASLAAGSIPFIPHVGSAYQFYISCIPFNFYALCAVSMTFLFCTRRLPWESRRMREARERARTTGRLDGPHARPLVIQEERDLQVVGYPPSLWDFWLPLGTLLSICIIPFVLWQLRVWPAENANCITLGFLSASCVSLLFPWLKGMRLQDVAYGVWSGCQSMLMGAAILGLAVSIGKVTEGLGSAQYLIQVLEGTLSPYMLPGLLTALCMLVAFATGTSFGTYAVIIPIALPLAYHVLPDWTYVQICFGAVLGGTVFGDQCSPISDTTILSSMFTGCDLMDHVRTQLPLALIAAFMAILLSTLSLWLFGL